MTRSSSGHAPRHKKAAKKRSTSKRTVRKKAIRKKAASKQAVRRKATRKQSASKRTVRKKPPKRKSVAKKAAGKQSAGSPKTRIDPSEADAGGQESIPPEQLIGWEVSRFWIEIRGTESSVQLMRVLLMAFAGVAKEKRDKFLEEHAHVHAKTGNRIEYRIPIERYPDFAALARECDKAEAAEESIPRSFLVTLVSQYDAFLGRLIRAMYLLRPEWLNASERVLSFAELQELGSMDAAKEFIIEKEVERVLRKSHSEQFAWFENKLGTTLRKDLDAWPRFIELTERRNLFVHCGGRVSSQYLSVCEKNRVELKQRPAVGDMLGISLVYLHAAYECLFEIGAKLAQVAWRKIRPDQVREAGDSLIKTSYSLLLDEEFDLARSILDFAAKPPMRYADDEGRRMVVINRAQAYKWSGDDEACRSILEREDWTACQDVFQLAVAVLRDDFAAADRIMRSLGKGGRVSERDYREWPLFREWRKRKSFATAYQDVFGREFSVVEQAERLHSKEGLVKLDEMLASKRKR